MRSKMSTNTEAGQIIQVTVHLRDKSTRVFADSINAGSGDGCAHKSLSENIQIMQEKVNSFLTELVEQEKITAASTQENTNRKEADEEDDDDEDDDDEDDADCDGETDGTREPPSKQQKLSQDDITNLPKVKSDDHKLLNKTT
ncbi:chromatin accessibility complex 16kD protein-like isoform X2 [Mya arenaria]|uniref:chromatin accessibility complex 16kD protein-like isoform X2 n=1 Tax=Mya arenaria TaxID=6604 RepID=UPI0022E3C551|nr:chromatin accessibility complex 16kD protein-like isoform X2 [Mya arenaria]